MKLAWFLVGLYLGSLWERARHLEDDLTLTLAIPREPHQPIGRERLSNTRQSLRTCD